MAPYRKGSVKYKYDAAFQHLDYRIFLPDYQITFESSQWFMSDDVVAFLTEIADMLAGWGLKLKKADSTSSIAIGCNYKGEHLVWFNQIPNFGIPIHNSVSIFSDVGRRSWRILKKKSASSPMRKR